MEKVTGYMYLIIIKTINMQFIIQRIHWAWFSVHKIIMVHDMNLHRIIYKIRAIWAITFKQI